MKDEQGVCASLGHMGNVYSNTGDHQKAIHYFAAALSIFGWSAKQDVIGFLCQQLGFSLMRTQNPLPALACFVVVEDICTRLHIAGWDGASPAKSKEESIRALGSQASLLLPTSDNTIEKILETAKSMIDKIVVIHKAKGHEFE